MVETVPLISEEFSDYIRFYTYEKCGVVLTQVEIQAVIRTIYADVKYKEVVEPVEMFKRCGVVDGVFVFQLSENEFLTYSEEGIAIATQTNACFKKIKIGDIEKPNLNQKELSPFYLTKEVFNCTSIEHELIMLALILYLFKPKTQKSQADSPIFIFTGSCKTTTLKVLRQLFPEATKVDPLPTDENLALLSSNSFLTLIDIDNPRSVSKVEETLVKISEGGTKTVATKYKDNIPFYIDLSTNLVLASSEEILKNEKLIEHSIVINLEQPKINKPIESIFAEFVERKSDVFASLVQLLPETIRRFNEGVKISGNTRFLDFVKWGVAVSEALCVKYDEDFDFVGAFNFVLNEQKKAVLFSEVTIKVLIEFINVNDFEGTATQLNEELLEFSEDYVAVEPNVLTRKINEYEERLKGFDIQISLTRSTKERTLKIFKSSNIELESVEEEFTETEWEYSENEARFFEEEGEVFDEYDYYVDDDDN